jgi:hypothetical protein
MRFFHSYRGLPVRFVAAVNFYAPIPCSGSGGLGGVFLGGRCLAM